MDSHREHGSSCTQLTCLETRKPISAVAVVPAAAESQTGDHEEAVENEVSVEHNFIVRAKAHDLQFFRTHQWRRRRESPARGASAICCAACMGRRAPGRSTSARTSTSASCHTKLAPSKNMCPVCRRRGRAPARWPRSRGGPTSPRGSSGCWPRTRRDFSSSARGRPPSSR